MNALIPLKQILRLKDRQFGQIFVHDHRVSLSFLPLSSASWFDERGERGKPTVLQLHPFEAVYSLLAAALRILLQHPLLCCPGAGCPRSSSRGAIGVPMVVENCCWRSWGATFLWWKCSDCGSLHAQPTWGSDPGLLQFQPDSCWKSMEQRLLSHVTPFEKLLYGQKPTWLLRGPETEPHPLQSFFSLSFPTDNWRMDASEHQEQRRWEPADSIPWEVLFFSLGSAWSGHGEAPTGSAELAMSWCWHMQPCLLLAYGGKSTMRLQFLRAKTML